jgi:hypothetical protein
MVYLRLPKAERASGHPKFRRHPERSSACLASLGEHRRAAAGVGVAYVDPPTSGLGHVTASISTPAYGGWASLAAKGAS